MYSQNSVTLVGNLGAAPELKSLDSGKKLVNVSIAVNMGYKDKDGNQIDQTEWHRITAWGKTAEIMSSLDKGDRIQVIGQLRSRNYQDKDGNTRYVTEINAGNILKIAKFEKAAAPF